MIGEPPDEVRVTDDEADVLRTVEPPEDVRDAVEEAADEAREAAEDADVLRAVPADGAGETVEGAGLPGSVASGSSGVLPPSSSGSGSGSEATEDVGEMTGLSPPAAASFACFLTSRRARALQHQATPQY